MGKLKYFLIPLLLSNIFSKGYGADIIIKYIIHKDSTVHTKHKVSDYMLSILNNTPGDMYDLNSNQTVPAVKTVMFNNSAEEIVVFNYKVNRDGLYFIQDLGGHEIFLDQSMDKDTIVLILNRILGTNKERLYLNDSIKTSWIYKITFPAKYKYMGFFDTIAYKHGQVTDSWLQYSFKGLNHDLPKYLSVVNKVYADRVTFYNYFIRSFYMPPLLKIYALKEIQYCYYNDLLEPLLWDPALIRNYPRGMRDTINKISTNLNNKALFENIFFYKPVILEYVLSEFHGFSYKQGNAPDSSYIINRLEYCKKNLKGESKAYVLAALMNIVSRTDQKNLFLLLYYNYDFNSSTLGMNKFVDSLHTIVTDFGNFTSAEVSNLSFEDSTHQQRILKDVFDKDIILIDCWATWCIPCQQQLPYLDSLASDFKNSVQFISVSADQSVSKWDKWLSGNDKANKFIIQLHALNGFENIFFRKLMINAIPRYILLSRSGKILNVAMPLPSEKEVFIKMLRGYLDQTQ